MYKKCDKNEVDTIGVPILKKCDKNEVETIGVPNLNTIVVASASKEAVVNKEKTNRKRQSQGTGNNAKETNQER